MEQYLEFASNNPILIAALVAIMAMIVYTETKRLSRKYESLPPPQAVRRINEEGSLVLDVRDNSEVKSGRIKGAKHIPLKELKTRLHELSKYKDKPVVVYCRSGNRSAQACDVLTSNEFEKVVNLQGGVMAWQAASLPLSKK
ncbi:MAG: rhodanese-like domain-containing protein [Thioalkalivibrio sp.]